MYFLTVCCADRRPLLANEAAHRILREEWTKMRERRGWLVGRYVVMPDHVHWFMSPAGEAVTLSMVVAKWKEWTSKRLLVAIRREEPLWQPGFFDHVLRSTESRSLKWDYVRENPVRAGLVATSDQWPYSGAIDFE